MEYKLLVPGPEYRRAVDLFAMLLANLSTEETVELYHAFDLYKNDACGNERDRFLNIGTRLITIAVDSNSRRGGSLDASKHVAVQLALNWFDWIKDMFGRADRVALEGEEVDSVDRFVLDFLRVRDGVL